MEIKEIYVYPIKSCKGFKTNSYPVSQYGFAFDRFWLVIEAATNKFVTMREIPKMCFIEPSIDEKNGVLRINAPGMEEITVPLRAEYEEADIRTVQIWRDLAEAYDQGDVAAKWFSKYLEGDYRLVAKANTLRRKNPELLKPTDEGKKVPQTAFADAYPFLLVSTTSLEDVQSKMNQPVSALNFRPNIVVSGVQKPFEEDEWKHIKIGDHTFNIPSLCTRCVMTTVDQNVGEKTLDTLKVLQKYRRVSPTDKYSPCVGVNMNHEQTGFELKVGDKIEVLLSGTDNIASL